MMIADPMLDFDRHVLPGDGTDEEEDDDEE